MSRVHQTTPFFVNDAQPLNGLVTQSGINKVAARVFHEVAHVIQFAQILTATVLTRRVSINS